jgi:pectinesterase
MRTFTALAMLLCVLLASANAQAYQTEFRVALDGSGDFDSIQAAINAAKSFPDQDIRIFVGPGVYEEKVVVWEWNTRLSLTGAGRDITVVRFGDHFEKMQLGRNSTFHTATLRVEANDFHASDLSVENSAGPVGQAVALSVNADRALSDRVAVRGYQDSLYATGETSRVLFRDCYVEGSVDFIFGGALAVVERCQIHSRADGYITAASMREGQLAGLVFVDSRLTADEVVSKVYLGRPWRAHAQTVFLNCEMGAHILPAGWHDWENPQARAITFYAEFGSRGPGASADQRVNWSKQLSADEAAGFAPARLLSRPGERTWFTPRD